jgi:hypothetical protein
MSNVFRRIDKRDRSTRHHTPSDAIVANFDRERAKRAKADFNEFRREIIANVEWHGTSLTVVTVSGKVAEFWNMNGVAEWAVRNGREQCLSDARWRDLGALAILTTDESVAYEWSWREMAALLIGDRIHAITAEKFECSIFVPSRDPDLASKGVSDSYSITPLTLEADGTSSDVILLFSD